MADILVINPNSSSACSAGIEAAVAPFRAPGRPDIQVVTLAAGPPAIVTWRHWHAVIEPLCAWVEARETASPAGAYIIACGSDPGIEAVRALTKRPVYGIFRSAVAAAVARAERFGIIAMVDSSKQRHLAALRALGLEHRLAGEIALNVSMEALLDPDAARAALIAAATRLADAGSETLILGCTGMAHHRDAIEAASARPVIEPCQSAVALALAAVAATTGARRASDPAVLAAD